jgi:CelD/BcsL family acetyltransferase involved in cellulose biosynthesis
MHCDAANRQRSKGSVASNLVNLTELSQRPAGQPRFLVMRRAGPQEATEWDEFVNAHPDGRFPHLWGYRTALEKAYGYQCVYLEFLADGKLCAVFPSIRRSRYGGWLISQPFNEYGGPLIQGLGREYYRELTSLMLEAAWEEKCRSIEIRGGIGCDEAAQAEKWIKQPLHSYALLNLEDPEKLWRKMLTNEARKGVNKARKSGLTAEIRRGPAAVGGPFFDLYLDSMKRLGVPPHSQAFFQHLAEGIGGHLVAAWVLKESRPAAILLGAITGRRIHIFVIASDSNAWTMRPTDLAHWELICWSYQEGLRVFDFGSARYGGQIQFKKKWGVSLYDYNYYLIASPEFRDRVKIETIKTSSKSMAAMSNLWRKLVPLQVSRVLGPPIRKYLTK